MGQQLSNTKFPRPCTSCTTNSQYSDDFRAPIRRASWGSSCSDSISSSDDSSWDPCEFQSEMTEVSLDKNYSFLRGKNGDELIHHAVRGRDIEQVITILENQNNSCNINSQTFSRNDTPLHIAAKLNDVQMIKVLLLYNADQTMVNNNGDLAKDLCRPNIRPCFDKTRKQLSELSVCDLHFVGLEQSFYLLCTFINFNENQSCF